jgi:hypothetical protein
VEDVREPLCRRQRLEHDEQREADGVGEQRLVLRVDAVCAVDDRVRQVGVEWLPGAVTVTSRFRAAGCLPFEIANKRRRIMATHLAPRKHRMASSHSPTATRPAAPRYKVALLTWAGAYAVITLILAMLGPAMAAWPLPLRTLLLSALMAPAMTWLVIPSLTRLFRSWLASA